MQGCFILVFVALLLLWSAWRRIVAGKQCANPANKQNRFQRRRSWLWGLLLSLHAAKRVTCWFLQLKWESSEGQREGVREGSFWPIGSCILNESRKWGTYVAHVLHPTSLCQVWVRQTEWEGILQIDSGTELKAWWCVRRYGHPLSLHNSSVCLEQRSN